jgi:hypothetical protein
MGPNHLRELTYTPDLSALAREIAILVMQRRNARIFGLIDFVDDALDKACILSR